jgi:hypothetical protein
MPFDFPQGGDQVDRIAEESQIHDDDFASGFGLLIETGGRGLHVGVQLTAGGGVCDSKIGLKSHSRATLWMVCPEAMGVPAARSHIPFAGKMVADFWD